MCLDASGAFQTSLLKVTNGLYDLFKFDHQSLPLYRSCSLASRRASGCLKCVFNMSALFCPCSSRDMTRIQPQAFPNQPQGLNTRPNPNVTQDTLAPKLASAWCWAARTRLARDPETPWSTTALVLKVHGAVTAAALASEATSCHRRHRRQRLIRHEPTQHEPTAASCLICTWLL